VANRSHYNLNLLIRILAGSLLTVPLATDSVRRLNEREKGHRCHDPDSWLLDGYQNAQVDTPPHRATEIPDAIAAVRRQSADG
jgi:hypothetical protein